MSKQWTSFSKDQLIMENWRKALAEDVEAAAYIKNQDVGLERYTGLLKKIAADPEFRKLALAGKTDAGGPADEALTVEEGRPVAAKDLTPTQKDIDFDKSFGDQMVNKWSPGATEAALSDGAIMLPSPGGAIPVLTFKNKYILDGHHRWSQVMMTNPDGKMAVSNLAGPALNSAEAALKATQLAIAGLAGNVETKGTKTNLLSVNEEYVKQYVMKHITDEVLQLLTQARKIAKPDKALAAEYYAGNLAAIQAKPAGKFAREKGMPQADDSGVPQAKVNKALAKGMINFDNAQLSDVKESKKTVKAFQDFLDEIKVLEERVVAASTNEQVISLLKDIVKQLKSLVYYATPGEGYNAGVQGAIARTFIQEEKIKITKAELLEILKEEIESSLGKV